jgi:hypothetical protein
MTQPYHFWVYTQKNKKSAHHTDTCTHMFIAALFTIAKLWNQPRCPSTDKWIKAIWGVHTHTMELKRMKVCHLLENGWNWRLSC